MNSATLLAFGPGHPWAHGAGWWPLAPIAFGTFWILVLAAVVTLIWFVTRRVPLGQRVTTEPTPTDRARAILAERFARGEISADEYDERIGHLH